MRALITGTAMLVPVLAGVAGAVILFAVVVAMRPAAYHIERTLEVAAPPALLFEVPNDLRRFAGVLVLFGKPWETADPKMQKTVAGPAGVGQSLTWSGNMEAGTGTMTIEKSVPGKMVGIRLEFVKPMKSTSVCVVSFSPAPAGSLVTWSMDGKHNFIGKAFGIFMNMDKMLGADVEKGLAQLKSVGEMKEAPWVRT